MNWSASPPGSSHDSTHTDPDCNNPNNTLALNNQAALCAICRNELATVTYFGIRICTGCRAFFRRSVKRQKIYQCSANQSCKPGPRNCGCTKEVNRTSFAVQKSLSGNSNRVACKFCRFQRCVDVGMLDSKLQLHSDASSQVAKTKSNCPTIRLDLFVNENLCEVLYDFFLLKRQIYYERYNTYHGKESKIVTKECNTAVHEFILGSFDYDLISKTGRRCENLFGQLDQDDWEELLTVEYVTCWVIFGQVQATIRNGGAQEGRIYLADSTFHTLSKGIDYWAYIYECIDEPDLDTKRRIYQCITNYFLSLSKSVTWNLCKATQRAQLTEPESLALLLLLFTSPSHHVHVSDKCRAKLKEWRNATLKGIAEHIERTGRNVERRLAEIIFLMTEFQNTLSLTKHAINLAYTASKGKAIPEKFFQLLQRSDNRRLAHALSKQGYN